MLCKNSPNLFKLVTFQSEPKKREIHHLFDKLMTFSKNNLKKKLSHHIMKDKFQQVFNLNDKEDHSNSFKIQRFVSNFC